jgi:glycosyltransferase involved in cell wall biosynthesis
VKVALVNYEYPSTDPECGGGGEVTRQLRKGLARRGHLVRVVTDNADANLDPGIVGPDTAGHYTTFPTRARKHIRDAVEWADVVNGHFSLPSSLTLPRVCSKTDTPLAVTIMGADMFDPTRFQLIRPAANLVNRYICGRADAVIAPSTDMVERVEARTGVDCQLIHYGIDPAEWNWRERTLSKPVQIVSVSRVIERKNLPMAIKAVQHLREKNINAEYTIVGTGDELPTLRRDYGHYDWLSLPGYVDNLQAALDDAHIFAHPSVYEAFGIVYLEALASGLPVVTTRQGGALDIVDPAVGEMTDADAPPMVFGLELHRVIANYSAYQSATRGYVESQFAASQMTDAYERLFESLINDTDTARRVRATH